MSTATPPQLTAAEYLARERAAETKNEYHNGEIVPMVGASRKHNLIATNILLLLKQQLSEPSEVYISDMRVRIEASDIYTYPDIVVVTAQPQFEDEEFDTLLNPTVIFEVLSKSTEAYDRGVKFSHYRTLDSLTDYVLVSQDTCRIEHFTRGDDDKWILTEATDPSTALPIPNIGCELSLAEVYHKVDFGSKR